MGRDLLATLRNSRTFARISAGVKTFLACKSPLETRHAWRHRCAHLYAAAFALSCNLFEAAGLASIRIRSRSFSRAWSTHLRGGRSPSPQFVLAPKTESPVPRETPLLSSRPLSLVRSSRPGWRPWRQARWLKKWLTTSSVLLSTVGKSSPHRRQYRTKISVRVPDSASRHIATESNVLAVRVCSLRASPFFIAFNSCICLLRYCGRASKWAKSLAAAARSAIKPMRVGKSTRHQVEDAGSLNSKSSP